VGGGCISREATIGSLYTNERTWTSWAGHGWVHKDTKQVEETQWAENCYGETPSASAGTKDEIEFQSIYLDGVLKQTYDFITAERWSAPDFDIRWATWDIWPTTPTSAQIHDCYRAFLSSTSVSGQVYSGVSRALSGLTFNRQDGNGAYVVWNPLTDTLVRSANPVWVV
jgi:hypothetical protein